MLHVLSSQRHKAKKVMVVDPDESVALSIHLTLKEKGIKTLHAKTAKEALEQLNNNNISPALFLVATDLIDMDGYTLCRKLRTTGKTARKPVLFLSPAAQPSNLIYTYEVGAQGLIQKPLNQTELLTQVFDALNGRFVMPTPVSIAS